MNIEAVQEEFAARIVSRLERACEEGRMPKLRRVDCKHGPHWHLAQAIGPGRRTNWAAIYFPQYSMGRNSTFRLSTNKAEVHLLTDGVRVVERSRTGQQEVYPLDDPRLDVRLDEILVEAFRLPSIKPFDFSTRTARRQGTRSRSQRWLQRRERSSLKRRVARQHRVAKQAA